MPAINLQKPTVVRRSPAFASLECRFGSYLIDTILFVFLQSLSLYFIIGYPFNELEDPGFFSTQLHVFTSDWSYLGRLINVNFYFLILHWLYYAGMEASPQQGTFGKIALDIKVTDLNGNRINFARATLRYFGRYLSIGTLFMGFFIAFFNRRHQTLHDLIAGCVVRVTRLKRG